MFASTPTGEDLFNACNAELDGSASEIESMMCYWYTTPCDCHLTKQIDLLPVCLPNEIKEHRRIEIIVDGLSSHPEYLKIHPEQAANKIFYQHYPCE